LERDEKEAMQKHQEHMANVKELTRQHAAHVKEIHAMYETLEKDSKHFSERLEKEELQKHQENMSSLKELARQHAIHNKDIRSTYEKMEKELVDHVGKHFDKLTTELERVTKAQEINTSKLLDRLHGLKSKVDGSMTDTFQLAA